LRNQKKLSCVWHRGRAAVSLRPAAPLNEAVDAALTFSLSKLAVLGRGHSHMHDSNNSLDSLSSDYKSAALDQLSYAGLPDTKAVFSELIKSASCARG